MLPTETLVAMGRQLERYKRSQFIAYAVEAMLARLAGRPGRAAEYETCATALVVKTVAAEQRIVARAAAKGKRV